MEEKEWDDYRIPFAEAERWKAYLKKHGFVVVSDYLQRQECEHYVGRFWTVMEHLSEGRLQRKDEATHGNADNYPFNLHGGMVQYVGHSAVQWDLRKKCKPIYEELWGTNELACSFDGFCFMNGKRRYGFSAHDSFLHTDQAPSKGYFWGYQGLVNLVDSGRDSGGLVVVPNSHLRHREYFKQNNIFGHKNWYLVPEHHKNQEPFLPVEKLELRAGDFALWDSRTFHCNTTPTNEDLRVCSYIAMIPKNTVPPLTKIKREEFFKENKSTNHHPGDGMKQALECPRFEQDKERFLRLVEEVCDVDKNDPTVLALL